MPEQRIGITGASSFIGRALHDRLSERGMRASAFRGDVTDPRAVREFVRENDVIFHLAGMNRGLREEVYRVNAVGGRNVAQAAREIGDRRLVLTSSNYIDRDPRSPYSVGKLSAEEAFRGAAGVRGCRASVFRLPNVYGPGALPFRVSVVATFCFLQARGCGEEMPIAGDGSQVREFAPIDRVADALLGGPADEGAGEPQYIRGEEISIRDLAEIIRDPERILGYPAMAGSMALFAQTPPGIPVRAEEAFPRWRRAEMQSVLEIKPDPPRTERRTPEGIEWLLLLRGRLAVDLYDLGGRYTNSVLLERHRQVGLGIGRECRYVLRAIGSDGASVAVWEEDSCRRASASEKLSLAEQ